MVLVYARHKNSVHTYTPRAPSWAHKHLPMHTHACTHTHTCTNAHMHTYIRKCMNAYARLHTHAHAPLVLQFDSSVYYGGAVRHHRATHVPGMYKAPRAKGGTHMRTYTHERTHMHTYTDARTHMHTYTHTSMHACAHTPVRPCTRAPTHVHTHTHIQPCTPTHPYSAH